MNKAQQKKFDLLYAEHLTSLTLQGKSDSTIDVYSRAVRRVTVFFDRSPDRFAINDLKEYFAGLVKSHCHYLIIFPASVRPSIKTGQHRQKSTKRFPLYPYKHSTLNHCCTDNHRKGSGNYLSFIGVCIVPFEKILGSDQRNEGRLRQNESAGSRGDHRPRGKSQKVRS
jgi:hypothetical protein